MQTDRQQEEANIRLMERGDICRQRQIIPYQNQRGGSLDKQGFHPLPSPGLTQRRQGGKKRQTKRRGHQDAHQHLLGRLRRRIYQGQSDAGANRRTQHRKRKALNRGYGAFQHVII